MKNSLYLVEKEYTFRGQQNWMEAKNLIINITGRLALGFALHIAAHLQTSTSQFSNQRFVKELQSCRRTTANLKVFPTFESYF